ncbi:MAG: tetratricopeptide repeat protein, partial [Gammaproteobacteria bacterium]|nr:tetratricopeptide repeat protein [Gammaproteobacteria bacterium]
MKLRRAACIAVVTAGAGFALPSAAFDIDYAADRAPALAACDADWHRGRRAEAASCYSSLLVAESDPRIRAEAAWALGNVQSANDYFQQAFDTYPDDPSLRTRWGKLFSVTHQDSEAVKLYQEALAIDPSYVPAILGLTEIAAERFEGQAREWVDEALALDPDSIHARLLLAGMELEVGNLDAADEALDEALALAEENGVAPLEIFALKASADLLRGVFESPWIDRALEYNPSYGRAYSIPAYYFVITRRYREAIDFYQRAVAIQPDLYEAHAELGVNLLRENRVDEAQRHLAIAYGGDPYSARTVNTLRLIDSFDN